MIQLSVQYPFQADSEFNWDYYMNNHIPMFQEKLGDAIKGVTIVKGLGGAAPDSPPTYAAMALVDFDSIETFQASFGPHAEEIVGDIPNYSTIGPVIQLSEIVSS